MNQRIADSLEVLDLIRSTARHTPNARASDWRQRSVAHVASRGVRPETVYAHLVGKDTGYKLFADEIDQLISAWINNNSPALQQWMLKSSPLEDSERIDQFFASTDTTPIAADINDPVETERHLVTTYRVLRDTALARRIKADMNYTCQICFAQILLGDGTPYAEAHHVKPLGAPHNGPDHPGNIVCVCPNCHVKLDYGAISADSAVLSNVLPDFIAYHNEQIFKRKT